VKQRAAKPGAPTSAGLGVEVRAGRAVASLSASQAGPASRSRAERPGDRPACRRPTDRGVLQFNVSVHAHSEKSPARCSN
jgi:hypothetical protein